ncbi:MAG: hypothetical protein ACI8TX_003188 [Hyphomicrobiaceae bacterium]|jgi:hypothetical protein
MLPLRCKYPRGRHFFPTDQSIPPVQSELLRPWLSRRERDELRWSVSRGSTVRADCWQLWRPKGAKPSRTRPNSYLFEITQHSSSGAPKIGTRPRFVCLAGSQRLQTRSSMGRKARQKRDRPQWERPQQDSDPASVPRTSKTTVAAPEAPAAGGGLRGWIALVLLAVLAFGAYANSFDGIFVLDDEPEILKNSDIKPPVSFSKLLEEPRPVVAMTTAMNWAWSGSDPWSFHLVNILLHIGCGWVLWGLLRGTLRLPVFHERVGGSGDWVALAAAAFFVVHPLQTESVTYIIQRAEIMASAAMLGVLWLSLSLREQRRWPEAVVAIAVVGVIGVVSKQIVVSLPALLLLWDVCFLSRGDTDALWRRRYHYLAASIVTVMAVSQTLSAVDGAKTAGFELEAMSVTEYLGWQFGTVVHYFRLFFWPSGLCFDCGYYGSWPVVNSVLGESVVVPLLILAAAVGAAVAAWWRRPEWTFGVLGAGIALAPTSSIFPLADVYVEHRMYLAVGLLAFPVAVTGFDLIGAVLPSVRLRSVIRWGAAGAICTALLLTTVARNEVWDDQIELWQDTVAKAPQQRRTWYTLGNELGRAGRDEEAVAAYRKALELKPDVARVYVNMGVALTRMGDRAGAAESYENAIKYAPTLGIAHRNLSRTYINLRRHQDAVRIGRRAVELSPGDPRGYSILADALRGAGETAEAAEVAAQAKKLGR